jgi:hypothetical protein
MTAILIICSIALIGLLIWLGNIFYNYVERTYNYKILTLEQIIVFLLLTIAWLIGGHLFYKHGLSDEMFLNIIVTLSAAFILTIYQFIRITIQTKWFIAIGVMTIQLFISLVGIALFLLASERRRRNCDDCY